MSRSRSKRGLSGVLFAVAVTAFVVFAPALSYRFVYDDHWTVENDPALDGALAPLLRDLFGGRAAAKAIPDATRPAMVTSLWVDRRLFGMDPSGYHFDSLVLYCGCSALAALVVFAVTRRRMAAIAGGMLFAVAPVHAEVVAAVNYREDLIAGIAVLGGLAWLFAPRKTPVLIDHAVLAAALFLFGLLGKESAVALVPMTLAIALFRFPFGDWTKKHQASLISLTVTVLLWGTWRSWLRISGRDDVPLALVHRGALDRLFRTARYTTRAVFDGLVPVRWSPDHAPDGPASSWWIVAVIAIAAIAVALARRRRTMELAAGVAVAFVAALPTSPLVAPINETADRYVFLSTLGGAIVWGSLAARLGRLAPRRLRLVLLGAAIVPLAIGARAATRPWQSDMSLWLAATGRAPDSPRAWTGLARTLRLAGRLDEADRAVARAIALDPTFLRARVTSVYDRLARGDVSKAREEIAEIRRLGGAKQLGMRHAEKCATLPPPAASRCIDSSEAPAEFSTSAAPDVAR